MVYVMNDERYIEAEWKMDFGGVKTVAASILDTNGWGGRYTIGPSVEMAPEILCTVLTLDDEREIRIIQPSVIWWHNGPLRIDGSIETPSSRAKYNFHNIEAVFRDVLGLFFKEAETLRAEGHRAIISLVRHETGVHALVAHLRAQAHEIGRDHAMDAGAVDVALKGALEFKLQQAVAWR
jgi:hypothetical protein